MGESPQEFENLHPRNFYRQFDRRADEDDKIVTSEAPYPIRQQLKDALWPERDTAKGRALENYKKLFIDHQLARVDQDRMYYLGKIADASNDQDRERYITALSAVEVLGRYRPALRARAGGTIMTELYIRTHIRFEKPKPVKLAGEAMRVMKTADPNLDVEDHLRRLDAVLPCPDGAEKHAECLFDTRKWRLEDAQELLIKQFLAAIGGAPAANQLAD